MVPAFSSIPDGLTPKHDQVLMSPPYQIDLISHYLGK
jgi:hypothetical protein